ncbi:pantoate--beta-alanine ligase [Neisseria sp. Ec49-e6-T10]|uniref:pantoate--beta-alanine ligase n=1 Tax=Neisseria sp. Ec49-e6-T10 TaxID=3140744 RepID=UPI003EB7DE69
MQLIHTIHDLRAWRKKQTTVAFVPTMGNLHEGHLRLVKEAKKQADSVIVSIFVNRLQFGQGEDFGAYPRTLEDDLKKLAEEGVSAVFAPNEKELYPNIKQDFQIEPPNIQNELCGAFRPGHFRGVATVVTKLFNLVQPDIACFGKKDYQQLHIIKTMVADLNIPIKIIGVDTGRAPDGLALSSRNGYLTVNERDHAAELFKQLSKIEVAIKAGEQNYALLEETAKNTLTQAGWDVDYIEIRNANTLNIAHMGDKDLVVLGAARLGKPRLIDNIEIHL